MGIEVLLKFYYCHCYTWNSLAKYQHILHSKIISVHDIMLNDSGFFFIVIIIIHGTVWANPLFHILRVHCIINVWAYCNILSNRMS